MKLRRLNIILLLMLVALFPLNHYYPGILLWGFIAIVILQIALTVYGCVNISSDYFFPVLCKATTDEKVVALSFDDGPDAKYTPWILDTLKKYDAPAAFFCIGKNIAGNEQLLNRIKDEGHIIGNHSYSHAFWFDMYGSAKMLADMRQMDDAVVNSTGLKLRLFRPPYGVTNPNLSTAVNKGKYIPVGWSIRSLDTKADDKQKLLLRIIRRLKPGAIILLHDSMSITAEMLPELIEAIKKEGYTIERPDKMLNISAYA